MAAKRIAIEYCVQWNYKPRAVRAADEVEEAFGSRPELIPGRGGVFDVTLAGELVFSKKQVGRFPDEGEVAALVQQHGGV